MAVVAASMPLGVEVEAVSMALVVGASMTLMVELVSMALVDGAASIALGVEPVSTALVGGAASTPLVVELLPQEIRQREQESTAYSLGCVMAVLSFFSKTRARILNIARRAQLELAPSGLNLP
jgi:hypothetical protein